MKKSLIFAPLGEVHFQKKYKKVISLKHKMLKLKENPKIEKQAETLLNLCLHYSNLLVNIKVLIKRLVKGKKVIYHQFRQ